MAALEEIQRAATYGRILLSSHAEERCEERGVRAADIRRALLTSTAANVGDRPDRWVVDGGTDIDGDALTLVVRLVQPGLYVVTVY
jgi:hypothetical protein